MVVTNNRQPLEYVLNPIQDGGKGGGGGGVQKGPFTRFFSL